MTITAIEIHNNFNALVQSVRPSHGVTTVEERLQLIKRLKGLIEVLEESNCGVVS